MLKLLNLPKDLLRYAILFFEITSPGRTKTNRSIFRQRYWIGYSNPAGKCLYLQPIGYALYEFILCIPQHWSTRYTCTCFVYLFKKVSQLGNNIGTDLLFDNISGNFYNIQTNPVSRKFDLHLIYTLLKTPNLWKLADLFFKWILASNFYPMMLMSIVKYSYITWL